MFDRVARLFSEYAAKVVATLRDGDYDLALSTREALWFCQEWISYRPTDDYDTFVEAGKVMYVAWEPFIVACDVADRIESLLGSLGTNNECIGFARTCHNDLTALLILADWCDEHNLPAAAVEARHLHNLTQHLLR